MYFNNSKTYYFMAGLPRSGSTLLSSILNQNPIFYSGPSSPVLPTMYMLEQNLLNDELFCAYPKPEQGKEIISNIINHFYSDIKNPIIIDKNRSWTAKISFIENYICKKAKIICPVRDIIEILTSFIVMAHKNPYKRGDLKINFIDGQLIKLDIPINDDNRCERIASYDGILGQSLNSIKNAIHCGFSDRICFVEYNDLVKNPKETLKKIYDFLGEKEYHHDFNNIKNATIEDDLKNYGIKDMHKVRSTLEIKSKDPSEILSDYTLNRYKNLEIWRHL